jgi:hypothetical protein
MGERFVFRKYFPAILVFILFITSFLSACSSQPQPTTEPTATLEPLTLGTFSAQLEGVGSHGTMACYTYAGDPADLEKVTLSADISQGATLIESGIPAQVVDGKTCFEVVDAKYVTVNPDDGTLVIPEDKINIQITATSPNNQLLQNDNQIVELGRYMQFPFLTWPFPITELCGVANYNFVSTENTSGHQSWDFTPIPNSTYPTLTNIPLLAPVDGKVINVVFFGHGSNNIWIFSPSVGYLIFMKHSGDLGFTNGNTVLLSDLNGKDINAGNQISTIGMKDAASSMPHLHMSVTPDQNLIQRVFDALSSGDERSIWSISNIDISSNPASWVDYVKINLFLDPSVVNNIAHPSGCEGIPWGSPEMPPQQIPITIDGKADDWVGYSPVLTNPASNSPIGMDLTELYTDQDENYLYIMLNGGKRPSLDWAVNFLLDSKTGGEQCGTADSIINLYSENHDSFIFNETLNGCNPADNNNQSFTAQYVWGDVLEARIPLIFLGDYTSVTIVKVVGQTLNADNSVTSVSMP